MNPREAGVAIRYHTDDVVVAEVLVMVPDGGVVLVPIVEEGGLGRVAAAKLTRGSSVGPFLASGSCLPCQWLVRSGRSLPRL